MNADQMRSALIAFADVAGGKDVPRATRLRELATLFDSMGKTKVAAIVATIETNWKATGRVARYPSVLREDVVAVQKALEDSTAKAQAKIISSLLKLLHGIDNQPFAGFLNDAISARQKRVLAKGARKGSALSPEHARKVADQLTSAADDRLRFDNLLEELKAQCKAAELKTIAKFYTGYETDKTKKDDIISAIRSWQRDGEMNRDRRAAQVKNPL